MNDVTKEKLLWLTCQEVDPKRSQIHHFVPDIDVDFYGIFWLERYATTYYDELAEWIDELDEDKAEEYSSQLTDLVDYMYEDAKVNNMWGFVYDW